MGAGLLLLVGLLLGPIGPAAAQPSSSVEARVSVDSVKIGERFTLTLVAEHAAGTEVLFPPPEGEGALFGDLAVVRRGEVQGRSLTEVRRVDSVAYEVAAFAVDSARVPVLPVRFVEGRDTTVAGTAPRLVPLVSVVAPDAEELRAPALLAAFPWPPWVWGALALAVVALLGGVSYLWWHRRGDDADAEIEAEPPPDPYEAASARFDQLTRRNPNDRDTCKAFYVDLTEALRVYLARRVGVRALECTTSEVVAMLHRHPEVPEAAVRRLRAVLERADLVKFADAQPEPAESRSVLKKARGVLDAIEAAQRRAEAQIPDEEAHMAV